MKKILVCGANGFMGTNIAKHFLQQPEKYEVYGVCSPHHCTGLKLKEIYSCDLTTQQGVDHIFNNRYFDVVIQAAATTSGAKDIVERPYIHTTDNAVMNSLILRACHEHNIPHFIFLSCCVMYQPGDTPRKETDFNEHDTIFPAYFGVGWTKVYIEKMCEFYANLGITQCTVLRHTNTYGPYDKYDPDHSHVFGATVRKVMLAKNESPISVWGNGIDTARDLIYVEDVAECIERAIQTRVLGYSGYCPYMLLNVSYGKTITVDEMVKTIIKVSDKNLPTVYDTTKPSIPTKLAIDHHKATDFLGWMPKTSFEEGVRKTIKWYKENYSYV